MVTPYWALSLIYWLHMLATVIWIGSLAALTLVVIPAACQALQPEVLADFLERVQRRLDPLAWLCLAVLVATGMMQMSANANYDGLLAISNRWAAAILAKHLVILGMVGISAYLTWGVLPGLRRAALLRLGSKENSQVSPLQQKELRLLRLNLVLGVLVLALTAIARAA